MHDIVYEMKRFGVSLSIVMVFTAGVAACNNSDELRNIERGRDNPPAIDASPPDEQN